MNKNLRALNEHGIQEFERYIETGAVGGIPYDLLYDDETSCDLSWEAPIEKKEFPDRYQFGEYLRSALAQCDQRKISHDRGLWTWLALFFFDQICPANSAGIRSPYKSYRYIYTTDYKHYYRHQVRTPFMLVRNNGLSARVLLRAPLERHGELVEQITSRQDLAASKPLMEAMDGLYYDSKREKAKSGVTSRNRPGGILRLIDIFKQFEATYDLHLMNSEEILRMLPEEFNKWQSA